MIEVRDLEVWYGRGSARRPAVRGVAFRVARLRADLAKAVARGNPDDAARASDELTNYMEHFTRAALDHVPAD